MSGGITLEEFVVSLGFAVDPKQLSDAERAAKASAERVAKAFAQVADQFAGLGKGTGGMAKGGALRDAFKAIGDEAEAAAKRSAERLSKISGGLQSLAKWAAGASASMLVLAERSASAAAAIDDIRQRTGASTRDLQRLDFAAEQSGTTIGAVASALRGLDVALVEGAKATGPAHDALRALNLTAAELVDLPAEQKFATIADALARIENPALKTQIALKLFGGTGAELLPLLAQGSSGIRALGDEAERLGLVMSESAIEGAAKFDDELVKVKAQLAAVAREVGFVVMPAVQSGIKHWREWAVAAAAFGVALGGLRLAQLPGQIGLASGSMATLALRTAGATTAALALGVAIGTALDQALGLSDALAGVNQTVGSRGGNAALGDLSSDERAALDDAVARRDAAQEKADSGTARNTPAERIYRNEAAAAQAEIDKIQALGTSRARGRGKLAASRDAVTTTAERITGDRAIARGSEAAALANKRLTEYAAKARKKGKGGSKRTGDVAFDAGVFAFDDLHGDEVRRLAERFGVSDVGVDAALKAGADALAQGDTYFVARNAALSRLGSSAGVDLTVKRQRDPLLSQILGDEQVPDIALSSIARGTEPQVLISNITNTFHQDFAMAINGAGDPREVASQTVTAFRELSRAAAEKATKTAKVKVLS